MRFLHFSHAGNDLVLRIVSFQVLKLCQERRIFRPPVGIVTVFSGGALAIVKLRTFPSESISEGSSKVISRYWPASNVHPDGFSNRKAMVPSATSLRSFNLHMKPGEAAAWLIIVLLPIRPK